MSCLWLPRSLRHRSPTGPEPSRHVRVRLGARKRLGDRLYDAAPLSLTVTPVVTGTGPALTAPLRARSNGPSPVDALRIRRSGFESASTTRRDEPRTCVCRVLGPSPRSTSSESPPLENLRSGPSGSGPESEASRAPARSQRSPSAPVCWGGRGRPPQQLQRSCYFLKRALTCWFTALRLSGLADRLMMASIAGVMIA